LRRTPNAADLGRLALAAILENFGYRQINLWYRIRGMWRFAKKDSSWAAVPRLGFDRADQVAKTVLPILADRRASISAAPEGAEIRAYLEAGALSQSEAVNFSSSSKKKGFR
jgi:hypothetical protein